MATKSPMQPHYFHTRKAILSYRENNKISIFLVWKKKKKDSETKIFKNILFSNNIKKLKNTLKNIA